MHAETEIMESDLIVGFFCFVFVCFFEQRLKHLELMHGL